MSVARTFPRLFGKFLLTSQELQDLEKAIRDKALEEGAAKGRHMAAVAWGKLGGLTQKKNIVVTPMLPTLYGLSSREATAMGKLGALTAKYNVLKRKSTEQQFPMPTIAECVERYTTTADREEFVTATEIGKAAYPQLRGWQVYKLFEEKGWVIRIKAGRQQGRYNQAGWQITESGKRYGKPLEYRTAYDQHVTGIHWRKYETLSALGLGVLVA